MTDQPKIFNNYPVLYISSTKEDGHMSFGKISDDETLNNINSFMKKSGWDYKSLAFMRILYGGNFTYDLIKTIDEDLPPKTLNKQQRYHADSLITTTKGVALLLPVADCIPVTIYDPKNDVLALAHMGWHSTAANLLQKLIEKLKRDYSSRSGDLLVYFGPSIPTKYYIHNEPIQLTIPDWKPYLKLVTNGYQIDVLGYNLQQLKDVGVKDKNIELSSKNTVESDEYESHYIHSKNNLPVARRHLVATMLKP